MKRRKLLVVLVITPLITALRNASCPTFSRCLAITSSILRFSSSIRFRRCSSFSRTLFNWDAIASETNKKTFFEALIFREMTKHFLGRQPRLDEYFLRWHAKRSPLLCDVTQHFLSRQLSFDVYFLMIVFEDSSQIEFALL